MNQHGHQIIKQFASIFLWPILLHAKNQRIVNEYRTRSLNFYASLKQQKQNYTLQVIVIQSVLSIHVRTYLIQQGMRALERKSNSHYG